MLGSLPSSYDNFIMTYHLNSVDNTLMELYNVLQTTEAGLQIDPVNTQDQVLAIRMVVERRGNIPIPTRKERLQLDLPKGEK